MNPRAIPLWPGFLAGIVIRYFMLWYVGVFDMGAYLEWGQKSLASGLTRYYHGTYFPIQYQIFEICVWLAGRLRSDWVFVFKFSNFIFDIPAFFLLVILLKRQGSNAAYALLYWLHPWFLSVFSLGYIDFQFTYFVLLSIFFLGGDTAKDYLLASIPLGVAFLMKPQALILIVAAFLYAIYHYARTRDLRPAGMLVGPVLIFAAYEFFFTASLFPQIPHKAAAAVLPLSYINITNVFPCLTGQMTNIWYPIAYLLKRPGDPIYGVSDQILVLSHLSAKSLATVIVLAVVAFHVLRVERNIGMTVSGQFIQMFGLGTLTVPFIMTSAHENHLFLGSVFLILFLGKNYPLSFKIAAHLLLVIQFLNIYGLYGEHPVRIAQLLRSTYSERLAVAYSIIGVVSFVLLVLPLLEYRVKPDA